MKRLQTITQLEYDNDNDTYLGIRNNPNSSEVLQKIAEQLENIYGVEKVFNFDNNNIQIELKMPRHLYTEELPQHIQ